MSRRLHMIRKKLFYFFVILYIIFLFFLPKSGIKISGIPLTALHFNFILLFFSSFILFKVKLNRSLIIFTLFCLYYIPIYLYYIIFMDFKIQPFFIEFITYVITPLIFILFSSNKKISIFFSITAEYILRKWFFIVPLFGLFIFFTTPENHIQGLTINYDDYGNFYSKANNRGDYFKLTSTYQNGNIYGISILMLAPYIIHISNKYNGFLLYVSLFLTLSRTVFFGIFLQFFIMIFFIKNLKKKLFSLFILFIMFIMFILYLHYKINIDITTLFDFSLGGRLGESAKHNFEFNIFPNHQGMITSEMVYLSLLTNYGLAGLILFFLVWSIPIFDKRLKTTLGIKVKIGLITYLFIAFIDGAICYIPTALVYWTLYIIAVGNHYKEKEKNEKSIST